jgi:tyrosyl-tRNA synthetase
VLAHDLTALVHGQAAASDARRASEALFNRQIAELDEPTLLDVMSEAPSTRLPAAQFEGAGKPLVDLVVEVGLFPSKSAARKEIAGGGMYINNERVTDIAAQIGLDRALHGKYVVLRRGKKTFHLVELVR